MNWRRIVLGGLLTGFVWTLLSSVSTSLVAADFAAAVPGNKLFAPSAEMVGFLFAVNLAEGIWAVWLYASIRPRYGAGLKTAAFVGVAWWIISTLFDVTWGSFGFVPAKALLAPIAVSLPEQVIATITGAWLYRERP